MFKILLYLYLFCEYQNKVKYSLIYVDGIYKNTYWAKQ